VFPVPDGGALGAGQQREHGPAAGGEVLRPVMQVPIGAHVRVSCHCSRDQAGGAVRRRLGRVGVGEGAAIASDVGTAGRERS